MKSTKKYELVSKQNIIKIFKPRIFFLIQIMLYIKNFIEKNGLISPIEILYFPTFKNTNILFSYSILNSPPRFTAKFCNKRDTFCNLLSFVVVQDTSLLGMIILLFFSYLKAKKKNKMLFYYFFYFSFLMEIKLDVFR